MASPPDSEPRFSADDRLPPVEPPSAGFIIQLFVIPAVIVGIIIVVWGMFNWLAQKGNDPRAYVEAIKRDNALRWQAAHNLADVLRGPAGDELKKDPRVARDLSQLLLAEIEAGGQEDHEFKLRMFLCHALRAFPTTEVLPALLKAAATQRNEGEIRVRRAALESLAIWSAPGISEADLKQLIDALITASCDDDYRIREIAAFALGTKGGEIALARLRELTRDPNANVRYNAGLGLARHGDAAAAPVLVEMLDPNEMRGVSLETEERDIEAKRRSLFHNGLEGVTQFADHSKAPVPAELIAAVEKLANDPTVSAEVRVNARDVLSRLKTGK